MAANTRCLLVISHAVYPFPPCRQVRGGNSARRQSYGVPARAILGRAFLWRTCANVARSVRNPARPHNHNCPSRQPLGTRPTKGGRGKSESRTVKMSLLETSHSRKDTATADNLQRGVSEGKTTRKRPDFACIFRGIGRSERAIALSKRTPFDSPKSEGILRHRHGLCQEKTGKSTIPAPFSLLTPRFWSGKDHYQKVYVLTVPIFCVIRVAGAKEGCDADARQIIPDLRGTLRV